MSKLIDKLKKFMQADQTEPKMNESHETPDADLLTEKSVVDLMQRLESTMENAYSCEEAFALLDEYVELVATQEEAERLMPLVKNHIDMCPGCREEFEILLSILKADTQTE